jgi:hypothetical protein
MDVSSSRTTRQVDHVSHAQALEDFAQRRASGREESAQQSMPIGLLQRSLPALSTTTRPLEDPGQLCRDRSLTARKAIESHAKPQRRKRKNRKKSSNLYQFIQFDCFRPSDC